MKATTRASGPLLGSSAMVLAISKAVSTDIGLIATFGGIGVIVNIIIVYIAVQIRGERVQNQEYRERMLDQ
jgi:acid phosphatase family membrane protein YuiD